MFYFPIGDYLYNKCDWDGAVTQYARTIGRVESSYVVRRFLDAQRVDHLAVYLENWHRPLSVTVTGCVPSAMSMSRKKEGDALLSRDEDLLLKYVRQGCTVSFEQSTSDIIRHVHLRPELTKLLVHCYAKLKDLTKIDDFVDDKSWIFDVKTAVKALREAGFVDHALALAKRRDEHRLYALICLEESMLVDRLCELRLDDAISHIIMLPFVEQAELLNVHAIKLVTIHPEPATELLMRLCMAAAKCRYITREQNEADDTHVNDAEVSRRIRKEDAVTAVNEIKRVAAWKSRQFATSSKPFQANSRRNKPASSLRTVCRYDEDGNVHEEFLTSADQVRRKNNSDEGYDDKDSQLSPLLGLSDVVPNVFIHHFIHQPSYLRVFLEYVRREARPLPVDCAKNIANTLIELVLNEWFSAKETAAGLRVRVEQEDPLLAIRGTGTVELMASSGGTDVARSAHASLTLGSSASTTPVETQVRLAEASRRVRQKSDDALALFAETPVLYDKYFALALVEIRGFAAGRLYLYEHVMRRNDAPLGEKSDAMAESMVNHILLKEYAKLHDVKAMLRVCRAQGRANPALWFSLINSVKDAVPHRSRDDFLDKCDDLADVLGVVDDEKALPLERCVQTCAINHNVPLNALSPYVTKLLANSHTAIVKNHAAIFDLRQQTAAMRQELQNLRCAAVRLLSNRGVSETTIKRVVVATPGTAWAAFLLVLIECTDYDTFSKHQDLSHTDLNEDDPVIAATLVQDPSLCVLFHLYCSHYRRGGEHRKWEQIKKSQRASADDHEQFFKELDDVSLVLFYRTFQSTNSSCDLLCRTCAAGDW